MAQNPVREERKKKIIDALNSARSMELHAIHQYMVQHYDLDNMDYGDMAVKVKLIAIDEMRHAEMLADRIEELGGQPTSDLAAVVEKGQAVEAIFPSTRSWRMAQYHLTTSSSRCAGKTATTRAQSSWRPSTTKSRSITITSTT